MNIGNSFNLSNTNKGGLIEMKEILRKRLGVFLISGLLLSGGLFLGGEEASAKQVIRSNEFEKNKITGKRVKHFNYIYFSVPSTAYLSSTPSYKIKTGVIKDTYKQFWLYYSSATGRTY